MASLLRDRRREGLVPLGAPAVADELLDEMAFVGHA
jgi:hypothetical protein